jgi:hypothetical protein
MTIKNLYKTIHQSIYKANKDHTEWTGGWWLQAYGVEGFLVSRIADGIMRQKDRPGYLTLETSFAELYANCKKYPPGRQTKSTKPRNRLDIALYHKNDTLSHVIEVKRFWSPECKKDIDRLCKLFLRYGRQNGGHLKEALFVQLAYVSCKKNSATIKTKLDTHFKNLENHCEEYIQKHYKKLRCEFSRGTDMASTMLSDDKTEAFSSFCLRIRACK